jgi:hypothetical protein
MTYSSGGFIQASDYNGFVGPTASGGTAGANLNDIWGVGSGDKGYGQTAISNASTAGFVSATQWASLVNTLSSVGAQTSTTLTSRSAPTAGTRIDILAALNTDLTSVTNARNNAAALGPTYSSWTGTNSKTAATSGATWTITITNTVTFADSNAARYFFNGGGLIVLLNGKSSTGATGDPPWNALAAACGYIIFTGAATSKTIAGVSYTGTTKSGGSGTPTTLSTATGYYALTPGAAATIIFKQSSATTPYTSNFIQHSVALNAGANILTFTTLWSASDGDPITGGTAPTGISPGTAPCTICYYYPPNTTYLPTASWGTPTVAAATA